MSRFFILLKVLLKNSLGLSAFRAKARKNKLEYLKVLGIGAIIVAGFTPAIVLYAHLLIQGFDLLAPIRQQGAILTLGIVLVSTMIFFFGIFYVINSFYFTEDTQVLLPLPLRAWQVLGARFTVVLCYEYMTELPFLLPPLLIYGIKSGAPVIYWIYAAAGYLLVPLVPLALATLPVIVIMRFANLGRRKDLLKILGGILGLILAIGIQFVFQKSGPNGVDPAYLQSLLTDPNGLVNQISRIFPSARYLALALVNSHTWGALLNMLIFLGLSLLGVAAVWLLGEKMYYKGIIGSSEKASRKKAPRSSDFAELARAVPAWLSYFKKELRLLVRTPTYLMNCVLSNFLVPIILVIPFVLQSHNQEGPLPWESIAQNPNAQIILMAILVGLAVFLAGTNAITATSLSREGKQFFISKYIPLPCKQQILAKLLSGYFFSIIGAVLIIIAARILIPMNIVIVITSLAVTLVALVPVIEAGLLIDIFQPKLDWENEQKAVKQNLNTLLAMLFAVLLGGVIIFTVIKFIHSLVGAALFMLISFGLAAVILYYLLMTRGLEQYRKLEA